jgi:hypothetical protein
MTLKFSVKSLWEEMELLRLVEVVAEVLVDVRIVLDVAVLEFGLTEVLLKEKRVKLLQSVKKQNYLKDNKSYWISYSQKSFKQYFKQFVPFLGLGFVGNDSSDSPIVDHE